MRLFPDSWYVEVGEEEGRVLDYLSLAIKEAGFDARVFSQSAGTGFLLKEIRIPELGAIYVYFVVESGRIAIEIHLDEGNREGFKIILRNFSRIFPKKPGLLDFEAKRRWDEVLR